MSKKFLHRNDTNEDPFVMVVFVSDTKFNTHFISALIELYGFVFVRFWKFIKAFWASLVGITFMVLLGSDEVAVWRNGALAGIWHKINKFTDLAEKRNLKLKTLTCYLFIINMPDVFLSWKTNKPHIIRSTVFSLLEVLSYSAYFFHFFIVCILVPYAFLSR